MGQQELAPKPTRNVMEQPAWFKEFMQFYLSPAKPSIAEAVRAYILTLPADKKPPTERQVRVCHKRINKLSRIKGREGRLALKARLAYKSRDFSDLQFASVYATDGKTFDAEVAHPIHGQPFRPEITSIIDVATRKVVGWSAALDENTFAVIGALRRACATSGIPAIFYTDRGPCYKNKAFNAPVTGFMRRAGITAMRALPYNSQGKRIERLNQVYTAAAKSLNLLTSHPVHHKQASNDSVHLCDRGRSIATHHNSSSLR